MTYRLLLSGTMQYATVQEALGADTWLATWLQQNGPSIRPAGTFHSPMAMIPPTPGTPATDTDPATPPCNGALTIQVHIESADATTAENLAADVMRALSGIVAEGSVFDCWVSDIRTDPE
jgi:hypothetical protein